MTSSSDSPNTFQTSSVVIGGQEEALFGWGPPVVSHGAAPVIMPSHPSVSTLAANTDPKMHAAPSMPGATAKLDKAPLIDWNVCQPDGTEPALKTMLNAVAVRFRGQIAIGFSSDTCEFELHDSRPTPLLEDNAEMRAALRSAVVEAKCSTQSCLFAAATGQSSLVLQQLRQLRNDSLVLGFSTQVPAPAPAQTQTQTDAPTSDDDNLEIGVVVAVHCADQLHDKQAYAELIANTQVELRAWLQVWRRCRAGAAVSVWSKRLHFYRSRKGRIGLVAAAVLVASLAIPLPYWPQRECVVEPRAKSFVASPIDGRIRDARVRPGDVVQQGQLLAHLDDEQLQWQLSTAEADYESACKRRDTALATRAGGELRLAQLEQERFALQIESLQQQLGRLELISPTDGVVVQGDWFQSDGAPVSRGDMLFEIAPMDTMRVEIRLSTDDLARIEVGDQATIRVDAAPGEKWTAKLNRIDPRGKVIDTNVVFGANIDVDNPTNKLRPGMKGTARISAGTQTIGWLLFYRPTMWAMKKLAW
ncbi:MAG: efflux RND transporter periplasmic adaptor subunit [Planctomycetales bacterium]|nr:efflux RND transporter periplasmic adaptor subunit [Planctomycetales bacterium]